VMSGLFLFKESYFASRGGQAHGQHGARETASNYQVTRSCTRGTHCCFLRLTQILAGL
jgi:hypothetical protein